MIKKLVGRLSPKAPGDSGHLLYSDGCGAVPTLICKTVNLD